MIVVQVSQTILKVAQTRLGEIYVIDLEKKQVDHAHNDLLREKA